MKRTIRCGVWETNSSSVHSMCICTQEEYDKWIRGELYFDFENDTITNEEKNKWGEDNKTYESFWRDSKDFEGYEQHYTSPSGDKIVVFGYYGVEY